MSNLRTRILSAVTNDNGQLLKKDLIEDLKTTAGSFSSQLTYLKMMNVFIAENEDKRLQLYSPEEWTERLELIKERSIARVTVAKSTDERLTLANKRLVRCNKSLTACLKSLMKDDMVEENQLRHQKAVIEVRLAEIEIYKLSGLVEAAELPIVLAKHEDLIPELPIVLAKQKDLVPEIPIVLAKQKDLVPEIPIVLAKKPVAKKPVAKKPVAKKPVAKKPVAKKPVAKKPVAKKPVAKKPVAKKPVAKKSVAKKSVAKKSVAKKSVAKK